VWDAHQQPPAPSAPHDQAAQPLCSFGTQVMHPRDAPDPPFGEPAPIPRTSELSQLDSGMPDTYCHKQILRCSVHGAGDHFSEVVSFSARDSAISRWQGVSGTRHEMSPPLSRTTQRLPGSDRRKWSHRAGLIGPKVSVSLNRTKDS